MAGKGMSAAQALLSAKPRERAKAGA
jgi:hypothetical protein